jgi:tRNA(Ile2)-agmatinylcytidine synthase
MTILHVGIDDTDSPRTGCTTYVASLLVQKLISLGASFIDYPNLIRLNPNVPWKTRGNGALCLRFKCDKAEEGNIKETVIDYVEKHSDLVYSGTEPGVVFYSSESVTEKLVAFSTQAIQGIVKMKDALALVSSLKAEAVGFKTGQGIIGALAAVGETLTGDHSYELITYRTPSNRGTKRQVDKESVFEMDRKTKLCTFNNVDSETGRVLITPHGPDPILYGIRGQTASIVKKAHDMIRSLEPVERWTVFRTNHGTDAHLRSIASIQDVKPYQPIVVKGKVSRPPRIIPRRHVVFSISDGRGNIDCAAYEPTGELRKKAVELIVGDAIEAFGGVRPASKSGPITVNLEKFKVSRLAEKVTFTNPLCPRCGKRMKSMGAGKGGRCDKCGLRSVQMKKQKNVVGRNLEERLYITSPRSQRHLTKPFSRYGFEKKGRPARMMSQWFWVNNRLV